MIISKIKGGIGNQLFCYAAARRLALKNNMELVIDDTSGFARDFRYKRYYQLGHFNIFSRKALPCEKFEPLGRYRRWLMRKYFACRPFEKRSYLEQKTFDFDQRLLNLRATGNIYLDGYWQSENYFKDIDEIIRYDLQITPPTDKENQMMGMYISESLSVAIHVRFFDLPEETNAINNVPNKYYIDAVNKMELSLLRPHYFVFSDFPELISASIPVPHKRVTFVTHNKGDENAYADLWLMTLCRNFIIANSSFSWWGAWLAQSKNKRVIAPGFKKFKGLSSWGFEGLLPTNWEKL